MTPKQQAVLDAAMRLHEARTWSPPWAILVKLQEELDSRCAAYRVERDLAATRAR